jgi:hypothetical protein
MSIPEDVVQIAAKGMYDFQLKTAREAIDKTAFDSKDLSHLFARLAGESETAQILIFASYLEDRIRLLIKERLLHIVSQRDEEEIFGGNGPLATFANRLNISYRLGWLSKEQKERLDAFRKIKNDFAHNAFKVTLSDARISLSK